MNVKLPQEVELWYIIPAIRRELARGLIRKGLKQRQVARKLRITDAAVSQYFSSKRGTEVRFNSAIKQELAGSVDRILEGSDAMAEINRICAICKKDGICCHVHKHHGAPEGCRVCFPK